MRSLRSNDDANPGAGGGGFRSGQRQATGAIEHAYVYDSFGTIVATKCGAETFTSITSARTALADGAICLVNPYTYTAREFDPPA